MSEPFITEPMMRGFQHELHKEAVVGRLVSGLVSKARAVPGAVRGAPWSGIGAGAGTGMGAGGVVGGAGGALYGGAKEYQKAREEGAGGGMAALRTLAGGVKGGLIGAGAGAVGGAALGAGLGRLSPEAMTALARDVAQKKGTLGAATRFGQRQVHQMTGWKPDVGLLKGKTDYIEKIRGGAHPAKELHRAAVKAQKEKPGRWTRLAAGVMRRTPEEHLAKRVASTKRGVEYAQKAQAMGLTSFPGYLKAVGKGGTYIDPATGAAKKFTRMEALKAGLGEQWYGGGPAMKAFMAGFPAASIAGAALTPEKPGGIGKGEQLGQAIGSVGYTLAPFTMGGSILAGEAAGRGLGAIGRGVDVLRGRKKKAVIPKEPSRPPASEPGDSGQSVPVERFAGPAMTGQVPEVNS